ncbi:hypothetical protein [Dendrosporobacter sp. 1207_IL3150]
MPENRDITKSEGVPAENRVVSEISINSSLLKHSDIGHIEKAQKENDER